MLLELSGQWSTKEGGNGEKGKRRKGREQIEKLPLPFCSLYSFRFPIFPLSLLPVFLPVSSRLFSLAVVALVPARRSLTRHTPQHCVGRGMERDGGVSRESWRIDTVPLGTKRDRPRD